MKTLVKRILQRLTYRLGYQNLDHLSLLLYSRLHKVDRFFIIQIGANDGTTFDPIHDFIVSNAARVEGLLLEPLSDLHARLTETYRSCPHIRPLRVAIHNTARTMTLYRVDPARAHALGSYARGIASFDRAHLGLSGTPTDAIVEETVSCISLPELIAQYSVKRIDLLCMDVEGYDSEILLALDFNVVQPAILVFEHGLRHGVMKPGAFYDVIARLNSCGYDVMIQDYDVVAHRRGQLAIA